MAANRDGRGDAGRGRSAEALASRALSLLVVDSNIAVEAGLSEAGYEPLGGEELVAPPLLWSEAPSVLHELRWRRAISAELAEIALARVLKGPVKSRRYAGLARDAWEVASRLGWAKTYDAEYVALARELDCRLVTLDARLKRGAARIADVVGPAEL
jgi:predicted nucleic acid-binding protein